MGFGANKRDWVLRRGRIGQVFNYEMLTQSHTNLRTMRAQKIIQEKEGKAEDNFKCEKRLCRCNSPQLWQKAKR